MTLADLLRQVNTAVGIAIRAGVQLEDVELHLHDHNWHERDATDLKVDIDDLEIDTVEIHEDDDAQGYQEHLRCGGKRELSLRVEVSSNRR